MESANAPSIMMQNGQMSPDMTNSPEMQKQCMEMMAKSEMQQTMKEMMKQPQMQTMMKQMLVSDPEFKQMMSQLVNNSTSGENTMTGEQVAPTEVPGTIDHNTHHTNYQCSLKAQLNTGVYIDDLPSIA